MTDTDVEAFRQSIKALIGKQFKVLQIPREILIGFEPSQIGTIVGTLMDACIPYLSKILPDDETLAEVGLIRHLGEIGEREGYPDYDHNSGKRVELKLLYVDPVDIQMKKPPTPREPSARLTQKVTVKNVDPERDLLLVIAYQLQPGLAEPDLYSPTIIDVGIFPVIECIRARDQRLIKGGGKWFGDYDTPAVLSKEGRRKKRSGLLINDSTYGRKEFEGKDYNEDTNFGKLARIPYPPLQLFLKKYGYRYLSSQEEMGDGAEQEEKIAQIGMDQVFDTE